MTIIDTLKKDYDQYLNHCLDILTAKIDILDLDYSNGETDCVRLIFVKKKDLNLNHAIAVLTMRLMLYREDWNDLKSYKKEDFERWIPLLEKQYEGSMFFPNVEISDFKKDFFVERLTQKKGLKGIKHNAQPLNFLKYKSLNPLFHERILSVSKTKFTRLQEEFYIETSHHFVLFNWYTTA
jgi:hypothetical protein